jgi:DNA-binding response OmpR family regulator
LIIEQSEAVFTMINNQVTPLGFTAHYAVDCTAARNMLLSNQPEGSEEGGLISPFDIVILDSSQDFDLLLAVLEKFPKPPSIIISGYMDQLQNISHKEAYIPLRKPIRESILHRALYAALGCKVDSTQIRSIADDFDEAENALFVEEEKKRNLIILIAEDNLLNQKIIIKVLEQIGFPNFALASNGKEALDMLSKRSFDVILMDVMVCSS